MQGSVEVLGDLLGSISTDKVAVRVLHAGVGAINESDVALAAASNAIMVGFNVRPERNAQPPPIRKRSISGCTPSSTNWWMR